MADTRRDEHCYHSSGSSWDDAAANLEYAGMLSDDLLNYR
jgi:hypothetical protein